VNKFFTAVQGSVECITVLAPELKIWERHTNLDDHAWYAERVNGRLAMITLTTLLVLEATTHKSIWELINVF
jgi:hypothetical protein